MYMREDGLINYLKKIFLKNTDSRPMGLGQYDSLGTYCGPQTASSVFLLVWAVFPDSMN